MCQSVQTIYAFCGCTDACYTQKCANPAPGCAEPLAQPTLLKLQCYCPVHSSGSFKTAREDAREWARVNKESKNIRRRESQAAVMRAATIKRKQEKESRQRERERVRLSVQ